MGFDNIGRYHSIAVDAHSMSTRILILYWYDNSQVQNTFLLWYLSHTTRRILLSCQSIIVFNSNPKEILEWKAFFFDPITLIPVWWETLTFFVGFFAFHQLSGTGKFEKQINMRVLHEFITSFRVQCTKTKLKQSHRRKLVDFKNVFVHSVRGNRRAIPFANCNSSLRSIKNQLSPVQVQSTCAKPAVPRLRDEMRRYSPKNVELSSRPDVAMLRDSRSKPPNGCASLTEKPASQIPVIIIAVWG